MADHLTPEQLERAEILRAVTSCPHEIETYSVTLIYDRNKPGKNALAQLVDRVLESRAPAPAGGVPAEMMLVPRKFVTGFYTLAHNYSLRAVAPDHYYGTERDAFEFAYARCGSDLLDLRAMLSAAPSASTAPVQALGAGESLGVPASPSRDPLQPSVSATPANAPAPLTDAQIEAGRVATFSTNNPYCPCDSKTMLKAVRWAERAHGIKEQP